MKMFVLKTLDRYLFRSKQNVNFISTLDSKMEPPIVTVKQGKLQGAVNQTLDGKPYYSFRGIPYAEPPVGELRFRDPLPPKSWSGTRDATVHGPICSQYDLSTNSLSDGSEDCLFLNIYTKSLQPKTKTPVMVYIHGGAYMSGSGDSDTYGPEYFLLHDVILVTLNYRLEVLGFLCLNTPEVPGNAGMKDQVLALRWVKENISKFGGDPDNVTIFGESAGSCSVTYHMMSPMSEGLFHKAIAQSGVCLQDWAITYEGKERAFRIGKLLGKETSDVNELLQFLRSVPALKLAKISLKTKSTDEKLRGLPMYLVPTVEKKFDGVESFLTEKPTDMILAGNMNKVPLMVGYNSAEGILMVEDQVKKSESYNKFPSFLIPREVFKEVSKEKLEELGQKVKQFYVGDKGFSNDTAQNIADLQTDLHFSYQTHRFVHFYNTLAPTYLYSFNYETDLNVLKRFTAYPDLKGACHADDLFYLFYSEMNKDYYNEQDKLKKIIFKLTKLWTDFARTGNPTPSKSGIQWGRFTSTNQEYIALNEELVISKELNKERVDFWNRIYRDAGLPCINSQHCKL